jgi:hypothetical protein
VYEKPAHAVTWLHLEVCQLAQQLCGTCDTTNRQSENKMYVNHTAGMTGMYQQLQGDVSA